MLKKFLYRTLILTAFLMAAFFSVRAEENDGQSDEVDGTISTVGTNNDANIRTLMLQQFEDPKWDAVLTNGTEGVNPVSETYRMYLNFTDIDGIDDIRSIDFKFFNLHYPTNQIRRSFDEYTTTGIREFDSSNLNNPFMVSDDSFIVRWTPDGSFQTIGLDSEETWELVSTSFETVTDTEFTLRVDFKISKVALHNNLWYLGALISNGADSDLNEESFDTAGPYVVNWYGEVVIPNNSEVRWEDVNAGSDFGDANTIAYITDANTNNRVTVSYISNGYYQQRVKSAAFWTATESSLPVVGNDNRAYLTTEAAVMNFTSQAFGVDIALEYDDPNNRQIRLDTELQTFRNHELDANYDLLNPNIWRARTPETGQGFDNFVFRVAISEQFQNATYVGDITIGIRNEADIISFSEYQSIAAETPITTASYVGIYASSEEELIELIENSFVRLPIYLRNGFIEITTDSAINGNVTYQSQKPVIGDIFVSGDNGNFNNVDILYGDLYVFGDNIEISDVNLKTHLDEYKALDNSLQPSITVLNASNDAPGGNLYIEGQNFTGNSIEINASVFMDNAASANLIGSTAPNSSVGENIEISNYSTLVISDYTISNGISSSTRGNPNSGYGDIRLFTNSSIVLGSDVNFSDMSLTNSTGTTVNANQDGWTLWLQEGSTFEWKDGNLEDIYLYNQSELVMTGGNVDHTIESTSSVVTIGGNSTVGTKFDALTTRFDLVGFSDVDFEEGIKLDVGTNAPEIASTLIITGSAQVENLKAQHNAVITFAGVATLDAYAQISENVSLHQSGGEIHRLRTYDSATLEVFDTGTVGKLYLYDSTQTLVSGGSLGLVSYPNESYVSVNHTAQLTVNSGSSINLDGIVLRTEREKADSDIIDNNSNNGLLVRDNATVIINQFVTIDGSTDLELRDNATLTVDTDEPFNRMLYDWSATFNEYLRTEGNSISSGSDSYVDFYVQPQGDNGSTTRSVRVFEPGVTAIDFDFTRIEGSGSAFAEARRIKSNFGYNSTVYLSEGSYLDENDQMTLNLDIDNLWLAFAPAERTSKKDNWSETFLSRTAGLSANSIALLERPVLITADSNRSHGIYYDLDNRNLLVSSSAVNAQLYSNYIVQSNASTPIIDMNAYQYTIYENYLTRDSLNNNTSAIELGFPVNPPAGNNFTSIISYNTINNIAHDAINVDAHITDSYLTLSYNNIGQSTRPILGSGVLIDSVEVDDLLVSYNDLMYLSESGILVTGATLEGQTRFIGNDINNFTTGHGVYLFDTTFEETQSLRFELNNINNSKRATNAVFIDTVNFINDITILNEDYNNVENGFVINNVATINDVHIESGNFLDINQTALKFTANNWMKDVMIDGGTYRRLNSAYQFDATNYIEGLSFTHDDRYVNGHRVELDTSSLGDDAVIRGIMTDISQTAVGVQTVSMVGFTFNGFELDRYATENPGAYAGIDLNAINLSGTSINQALRKNNVSYFYAYNDVRWRFNDYTVINATFENGSGPAIRFHVTDNGIYANNIVFNPDIVNNFTGIDFQGALTSSDPISKIFGSASNLVLNSTQADLRALLITQGVISNSVNTADFNRLVNTSISGLSTVGLRDNIYEVNDVTNTIDFNQFRILYANLGYESPIDTIFINKIDNATTLMVIPNLDQSGLSISGAVDKVSLVTTATGVNALLELDFLLDGTSIRGVAVDDLNAQDGNIEFSATAPSGAIKAQVFVETEGNTVLQSQQPNVASNTIEIALPVATTNGSVWTPVGADTAYRVVINWLDGSNNIIANDAFTVSFDRSGESSFITAITSAATGTDIENLLDTNLLNRIDASVSTTALFANLKDNIDENTYTTYADFVTLLEELANYELQLVESLAAANALDMNSLIPDALLNDVSTSLTNTSITLVDDGKIGSESINDLYARLITINTSIGAVEIEKWVREDIISNQPYATFSDLESSLESIVNNLIGRTVYDANALTISPASMLVTTNTSISIIRTYLDSLDNAYPSYVTGSVNEVLVPVDDWEYVGVSWETSNDSAGVFEFTRTFRFPDGSVQFFDADRATTMAISVTVSTIQISSGLPEISLVKTTADTNATLNIAYTLDDDGSTIIGEMADRVDGLPNASITLSIQAPSGIDNAEIRVTYDGLTTTTSATTSSNQLFFNLPIATQSGIDYLALADSSVYAISIVWQDNANNALYTDVINIQINRNDSDLIDTLINASSASELRSLLDTATQQIISDSAVNATEYYDSLFVNLGANSFTSYSQFETLFSELLTFKETLITAVAFANGVTGDTTVNAEFYDKLNHDVVDSLNGTFILRPYGDTITRATLINQLNALNTSLQNISESKWIAEDIEALNDSYADYEALVSELETLASNLQNLIIYDPSSLVVPTPIIISTGTSISDIGSRLDGELNRPLYMNSDSFTEVLVPSEGSNWTLVSGDLNQEGVYTVSRDYVFAVTSNNFGDITRSRTVTVLTTVSTISTESLTGGVTYSNDSLSNEGVLDLSFDVDNDGRTVRGEAIDRIANDNGEITFRLRIPASVNHVQIKPFINGAPSSEINLANISNNFVTFSATYAELDGSDWKLIPESTVYRFDIAWYASSDFGNGDNILNTLSTVLNITHTPTSAIASINNVSDGLSLEALLNDSLTNQVSNASISSGNFYDLLATNIDQSNLSTYAEFETQFDDLLTIEVAQSDSLDYAKNTLTSDETSPDLDLLVLDVVNAVSGSSVVRVSDGAIINAQDFAYRLNQLHISLSAISEPVWISEDLVSDRANFDTFAELETALTNLANNLEGHQVATSALIQISPSGVTGIAISTGEALIDIRNIIDSVLTASYPKYVEGDFDVTLEKLIDWTPNGISNWNNSTERNTPGTYQFTATFKYPDGSKLYSNTSRDQNVDVTISITVE